MVDAGNPEAIAKSIETLAADRGLCELMAEKGRKRAIETFDIDAMLTAYEKVYATLSPEDAPRVSR